MPMNYRPWTVADSRDLFHVDAWGRGFFRIGDDGELRVTPDGNGGPDISLPALVEELRARGLDTPLLIRFSDILRARVSDLYACFGRAIDDYGYGAPYRAVYPIKVNQQRHVVEDLLAAGREYHLGLEAGSKPELLVALAMLDDPDALIVCNGYKDEEYVETALLAQKLGLRPIIVVDRLKEVELILEASERLGVRPSIGVRAKLAARGAGRWAESTGDRSKFGLTTIELIELVERLRAADRIDCLELLHFHIGSQITSIRAIKEALREASRIYVELAALGAAMRYVDVGGGLAVDYDGSSTNYEASANYTTQEYANDVVAAIQEACQARKLPPPTILSESGRALTAHHSVLVFEALETDRIVDRDSAIPPPVSDEPTVITNLRETIELVSGKSYQEPFHDALQLRDEVTSLFKLGYLDLRQRAIAEKLFRACLARILEVVETLDYVPRELANLEARLSDTYFCNFSVFQSAPDHWAVKQVFPTMPIHRLTEEPTRRATIADLTCDSDGKVDRFIHSREVKRVLELHPLRADEPYYLGMFLLGAYQEILGDLHNLFGDTNAVHVVLDGDGGYRIGSVVEGDSVTEVLGYVQYDCDALIERLRQRTEDGMRTGAIDPVESAKLLRAYREGLGGYTYLEKGSPNTW